MQKSKNFSNALEKAIADANDANWKSGIPRHLFSATFVQRNKAPYMDVTITTSSSTVKRIVASPEIAFDIIGKWVSRTSTPSEMTVTAHRVHVQGHDLIQLGIAVSTSSRMDRELDVADITDT